MSRPSLAELLSRADTVVGPDAPQSETDRLAVAQLTEEDPMQAPDEELSGTHEQQWAPKFPHGTNATTVATTRRDWIDTGAWLIKFLVATVVLVGIGLWIADAAPKAWHNVADHFR